MTIIGFLPERKRINRFMANDRSISKKQISINLVANIVSYSSNLFISFFLTPFLIESLGKDVYSFFPIASTIASYLTILTSALNTMASRFFTVELVKGDEKEANIYYSSMMAANVVISGMMMIPMSVIVLYLDDFMNVPIESLSAIRMLFVFIFSAAIVNVLGSIYGIATFAKNRIDLRSVREIITSILRFILYIVLYKILPASITYVGLVTLIVAFVSILIQLLYTRKLLPGVYFSIKNVSFLHTKKLLSSTSWSIVFTFGNVLISNITLILLNVLYSADAGGSLSIVITVPSFINGVICMLAGVFFPVVTYKIAENDTKGAVEQILSAQCIIAVLCCAVISVFSGLASEFFALWVPAENSRELSLLSLVTIFPYLFVACTWILVVLNISMNKVKIPAIVTLIIGVVNVVLIFVAVKMFTVPYIVIQIISSVLQTVMAGVFLPMYASKELGVSFTTFYAPLIKAMLGSVICFFVTVLLKKMFIIQNWFMFILVGGIIGVVSLMIFALIELGPDRVKSLISTYCAQYFVK